MSPTYGISSKRKLSRIHILGLCGQFIVHRVLRTSRTWGRYRRAFYSGVRDIHCYHFLLSLKYGFKNIRRIDTYCLIIALVGIIPWLLTKDPTISVVIAVTIDLFAFSSTCLL